MDHVQLLNLMPITEILKRESWPPPTRLSSDFLLASRRSWLPFMWRIIVRGRACPPLCSWPFRWDSSGAAVCCVVLGSTLGLNKNVSRHCRCPLGRKHHSQLRAPSLQGETRLLDPWREAESLRSAQGPWAQRANGLCMPTRHNHSHLPARWQLWLWPQTMKEFQSILTLTQWD